MKVAGIICEYDPFHNGHERQIKAVREKYGEDTAIVAVMSGNYTQRGEPSLFDKLFRAECAVMGGVDLVVELPFPFCSTGAEYFADAGVKILKSLGIVDVLSFGTETEDEKALREAAVFLSSDTFRSAFEEALKEDPSLGHPALTEKIFASLYGQKKARILKSPNNVLAIEYLKAVSKYGCDFEVHTVKRNTDYSSETCENDRYACATALRSLIGKGMDFSPFVPTSVYPLMRGALDSQNYCEGENALSLPVLTSLLLNEADAGSLFGADAGLYHRLQNAARQATDLLSLLTLSETKKYTNARLKRTALYSLFGVTSSDVECGPTYVQVLAADGVGCSLLKQMKKTAALPILTKPADVPASVLKNKALSDRADAVYALCKVKPSGARDALAFTPFIKK